MKMRQFITCVFVLGVTLAVQSGVPMRQTVYAPTPQLYDSEQAQPAFGRLPLQFEVNQGQADTEVRFLARGSGHHLFLTLSEAIIVLPGVMATSQPSTATNRSPVMLRLQFAGANPEPELVGLEKLPGVVNHYVGNDQSQWRTAIPTYAKVQYKELYPGIDALFYDNGQQLEHDFVVAPGSDPNAITLRVQGADALDVDVSGDLVLRSARGQFRLRRPFIYQEGLGSRHEIAGGYVLKGTDAFGFSVAAYDASRPLVIDPVLDYSTYFGGDGDDYAYAIATDTAGNIYLTGATNSTNYPVVSAAQSTFGGGGVDCPTDLPTRVCYDAFVTKINAAGNAILYSTYLGLPGEDEGRAIAVDASGNAYITGQLSVAGEPPLEELYLYHYALVAKLGPNGNLIYGGAFGDTSDIIGLGIAADAAGRAYVTGEVTGAIPTTGNAIQPEKGEEIDAFVAVFDPAGYLLYATYLGGSGAYCGECMSSGRGIAVDNAGYIYVTGQAAPSFPVTANAYQTDFRGFWQAFLVKIDRMRAGAAGLVYSTLLGGTQTDIGKAIALDSTGKVYVTGAAKSDDLPTTAGAYDRICGTDGLCNPTTVCWPTIPPTCETKPQEDVFVAKFDLSRSGAASLLSSTYVGGSGRDEANAIAVDASGNVYLTGFTVSPDFPMANPLQPDFGGNWEAIVLELNPMLSQLSYATYLGGGSDDEGYGVAVAPDDSIYVTGYTGSGAFPIANPLRPRSGGWEAFITKLRVPNLSQRVFMPIVVNR